MTSRYFEGYARHMYDEAYELEKPYRAYLDDPTGLRPPTQVAAYLFLEDTLEHVEEDQNPYHATDAEEILRDEQYSYFRKCVDRVSRHFLFLRI